MLEGYAEEFVVGDYRGNIFLVEFGDAELRVVPN